MPQYSKKSLEHALWSDLKGRYRRDKANSRWRADHPQARSAPPRPGADGPAVKKPSRHDPHPADVAHIDWLAQTLLREVRKLGPSISTPTRLALIHELSKGEH